MRVLLDTCAVIFANESPEKLSVAARVILSDPDSEIYVSAVSHAEIACSVQNNRLALEMPWQEFLPMVAKQFGWKILPVTLEVFQESRELPPDIHRDPCDRIIIATARLRRLTILTTDGLILEYAHVRSMK